jgi:release factor glutamine methyltransferase
LREARIDDAELEAEVLLRHALTSPAAYTTPSPLTERDGSRGQHPSRAYLLSRLDDAIASEVAARFQSYIQRRLTHEPSAYITGQREFYGLDFFVTPDTLIPRPETETLVEAAIELARSLHPLPPEKGWDEGGAATPANAPLRIADIGTGCGAIAIAVARVLPQAHVCATDASAAALAVAAANARHHGVARRLTFLHGDLLSPLPEPVDLIVANLPYVKRDEMEMLAPELRDHEPRLALDGGQDGLALIRRLLIQAPARLRAGGGLCLEFGDGQSDAVRALAAAAFPNARFEIRADLAGRPRVVVVRTR